MNDPFGGIGQFPGQAGDPRSMQNAWQPEHTTKAPSLTENLNSTLTLLRDVEARLQGTAGRLLTQPTPCDRLDGPGVESPGYSAGEASVQILNAAGRLKKLAMQIDEWL